MAITVAQLEADLKQAIADAQTTNTDLTTLHQAAKDLLNEIRTKFNRDIRKNYLDLDGLFDELFQFTAEFGIKRPDKKNKIQK